MYSKKECIAMLLAGGQGSRLFDLTKSTAKPAVGFGGKYKIIDFPLSNCINSGIDTVGVLTQYQPLVLNEYIENGAPWDLDRSRGGLYILPPYRGSSGSDWYSGTANAIYQNINFIDQFSPEYILVLSGDHIYQMDYSIMLKEHKRNNAVCTIATITVSNDEARRFGICNTREDGSIYSFEEKPKNPKSNQASMGIYIFNTEILKEYLEADDKDPDSSNDFGKNIIPNLLASGEKVYSYKFDGYWKDVGTVYSLWEANMDLLGDEPRLLMRDRNMRVFSKNQARPPQFIGKSAKISNSLVSEGCIVYGQVTNSIISGGVYIEEGASVINSVIMENVRLESGAIVSYSIVDADVTVKAGVKVGYNFLQNKEITVVEKGKYLDMHFPSVV